MLPYCTFQVYSDSIIVEIDSVLGYVCTKKNHLSLNVLGETTMMRQIRQTFTAVFLLLLSATICFGDASMSITPATGNSFTVQGSNMDGIAGIDLTISYDSSLHSPSVTPGSLISGAMMAANTTLINNSIKIAIITTKTFSGSGPIAIITFASGSGSLKIASQNMINNSGTTVSGTTTTAAPISTPGIPFSQPSPTPATTATGSSNTAATATTTTGSSTATSLGAVNIAPDAFLKSETKPVETTVAAVPPPPEMPAVQVPSAAPVEQAAAENPQEAKKPEETKYTTYAGVIERFRAYQGEKSPAILVALFKLDVAPSIRQEPAVVLSDGKTTVTIIAGLTSEDGKSPNFALNGAKLISLKKAEDSNKWTIEALPQENIYKAGLTILNGSEIIEYPITVAPFIKDVAISDSRFAAFLKNSDKSTDLNGDGKHDYIDDFIYTANYIVLMEKARHDSIKK
jgi:hypothetical protein